MQLILSGSKRFRKNGGPHLKGSRRPRKKVARPLLLRPPKVVFFGAQAEKKRFFILFYRRRLVMVFGGEITFSTPPKTFSTPPKKFSATNIFFRPPIFFFDGFFFIWRPKTKNRLFRRAPKEQYFSAPKRRNVGFFLFFSAPPRYGVRRPNDFFDPQKYFAAAFFFF